MQLATWKRASLGSLGYDDVMKQAHRHQQAHIGRRSAAAALLGLAGPAKQDKQQMGCCSMLVVTTLRYPLQSCMTLWLETQVYTAAVKHQA